MRLPLLLASVALLVVASCGRSEIPAEPETEEPTPVETTTTAPAPSADDLVLAPGGIGPVEVGMTKDEAVATGYFDADVENDSDACETTTPLKWKSEFPGADVLVDQSGTIVSLGVAEEDGPRTTQGFGVGSTFGELLESYGGELSAPEEAGYGQVGVYVQDGEKWLGFLFGEAESVEQLDNDPGLLVTFAEATEGEQPSLMRDGC